MCVLELGETARYGSYWLRWWLFRVTSIKKGSSQLQTLYFIAQPLSNAFNTITQHCRKDNPLRITYLYLSFTRIIKECVWVCMCAQYGAKERQCDQMSMTRRYTVDGLAVELW